MSDKPTVLVTGGAGYIGSHAVLALRDAGYGVVVIDNLVTGFRWAVPEDVAFVEGDIADQPLVQKALRDHGVKAVMHFAGSVVVLGLFGLVCFRIWRTAQLARDRFGMLLCAGVLAMLIFQVFQNVGMTVGLMPITGIPLPFMSYGGSSVIASWVAIGLVLNVHMRRFG
jgi:NAD(P)-dependent dehydrogenase (short-subunit alcohol dehydrogenase family)